MKPKTTRFRIRSVELPADGGKAGIIAMISQPIYSFLGLVFGSGFMLGGIVLCLTGYAGSSHFVADFLGHKIDLSGASAGVIPALFGVFIIYITKFKVKIHWAR